MTEQNKLSPDFQAELAIIDAIIAEFGFNNFNEIKSDIERLNILLQARKIILESQLKAIQEMIEKVEKMDKLLIANS